ncbi:hypothetical protein TH61_00445 [Rufibacter sp. DG15C]|uniref:DUF4890 domain-containing protein n=1 Tax=Rufibacter sp. DG15C TaxID=1379909 RepID=UPI00078E2986|nr:DUF4890 domain-containing protein [Rufibacter sp. DG15C]AMM49949.1 hypothetical protein TH61_00445 [Rufibacter sp. DG15C]
MKKLILMLSMGVLFAGTSFAQDAPQKVRKERSEQRVRKDGQERVRISPEERAAKRTQMMTKKYDLNKSQQAKLQALFLKQSNEMAAQRSNRLEATQKDPAQRQARKAKQEQYNAEIKRILTKKQYAQFEADRKEMKEKHAAKKGQRPGRGQRQLQKS